MFLLSIIFIAVVIVYIGLALYFNFLTIKHYPHQKYLPKIITAIFILIPTYDIIITNVLGGYYCLSAPSTFIDKTVQYPESIYWEDNVYPGFNEEDRELMIKNYLNGIHLKKMALNGDDGKVYVYEYKNIPKAYYLFVDERQIVAQKYDRLNGEYKKAYKKKAPKSQWIKERDKKLEAAKELDEIKNKVKTLIEGSDLIQTVYEDKDSMPKMNYTVTFNEVKLNSFVRKFLYSDETRIIDNAVGKNIAQNQRIMKLFYNITPRLSQTYYDPEPMCGERAGNLEYKAFNAYRWRSFHFGSHSRDLHEILIKRFEGEK